MPRTEVRARPTPRSEERGNSIYCERQWYGQGRDSIRHAWQSTVLLANGEYSPVQALAGKMVANTNGGTTLMNRVHRFYLHNPWHRLVLFKGNLITKSHYIKRPAGEYNIWMPSAEDNHQHGPLPGMWTQADGRQWWREGFFH